MKFIISGRKVEITEAMRDKTVKKLSKLDKFFNADSEAHIRFAIERGRHIVEVTIHQKGFIFRAEEQNSDMYVAIDKIVDLLERQIVKNKTRLEKKLKENAFATYGKGEETYHVEEEHTFNVVKTKRFAIKPMAVEEAILQMNMLGHEFFMFTNSDNSEINVVYKRKDGNYGLLEATGYR